MRIREGFECKAAFNTSNRHYEYLVMPFGLTNATAVFQALVNDILRDFLNRFVFIYLDDILVFSPDLATQVLLNNQVFVLAEKCDFHAPFVSFLIFVVWEGTLGMDTEKVQAVRDWPVLESR